MKFNLMEINPRRYIRENNIPKWLIAFNVISLLPILIWPLIAFGSIFILDNPSNVLLAFLLIIAIDSYPLYLLAISFFSIRLYKKNKFIAGALPFLPLIFFIWLLSDIMQFVAF